MEKSLSTGESLILRVKQISGSLSRALSLCTEEQYCLPLPLLSGSSIGEHTRHIIEFFQCLQTGLETQRVDYGARKRERTLECNKTFALNAIMDISNSLPSHEQNLWLHDYSENGMEVKINTGYYRELLYAIEHAIHHMAIIKIGLKSLNITVENEFGVAPSTIAYKTACAS
jgi:3-dehydroquinate dehydratase